MVFFVGLRKVVFWRNQADDVVEERVVFCESGAKACLLSFHRLLLQRLLLCLPHMMVAPAGQETRRKREDCEAQHTPNTTMTTPLPCWSALRPCFPVWLVPWCCAVLIALLCSFGGKELARGLWSTFPFRTRWLLCREMTALQQFFLMHTFQNRKLFVCLLFVVVVVCCC